jgi:hypothetical protein
VPRIDVPSPPYDHAIAGSLQRWMPLGSGREIPLIFRALHAHRELASRVNPVGAGLLAYGRLPARERELATDGVTGRHGAEHEWGLHASAFGSGRWPGPDQRELPQRVAANGRSPSPLTSLVFVDEEWRR